MTRYTGFEVDVLSSLVTEEIPSVILKYWCTVYWERLCTYCQVCLNINSSLKNYNKLGTYLCSCLLNALTRIVSKTLLEDYWLKNWEYKYKFFFFTARSKAGLESFKYFFTKMVFYQDFHFLHLFTCLLLLMSPVSDSYNASRCPFFFYLILYLSTLRKRRYHNVPKPSFLYEDFFTNMLVQLIWKKKKKTIFYSWIQHSKIKMRSHNARKLG